MLMNHRARKRRTGSGNQLSLCYLSSVVFRSDKEEQNFLETCILPDAKTTLTLESDMAYIIILSNCNRVVNTIRSYQLVLNIETVFIVINPGLKVDASRRSQIMRENVRICINDITWKLNREEVLWWKTSRISNFQMNAIVTNDYKRKTMTKVIILSTNSGRVSQLFLTRRTSDARSFESWTCAGNRPKVGFLMS